MSANLHVLVGSQKNVRIYDTTTNEQISSLLMKTCKDLVITIDVDE